MNTKNKLLLEALKHENYSITASRMKVFEALSGERPLSIHELVTKLRGSVDRSSVYRTIELFEKLGIVIRLHIGWKYKLELSGDYIEHHHHMSCLRCGKLVSIAGDSHIEEDLQDIAKKYDFVITGHQVEVQGFCNKCSV
jgi:Fur family ferric uptake transcriptional regulator